jgi:hypothetical protein
VMVEGERIWDDPGALAIVTAWGVAGLLVAIRTFGWEPRER